MRLLSTIQVAADEGDSSETCILLKVPKGQVPVYSESMSSYGASWNGLVFKKIIYLDFIKPLNILYNSLGTVY